MERGLDQLIFFAFIVLAALVDWVVRVIRNRNAPPRPPVDAQEDAYFEAEEEADEYPARFIESAPAQAPMPREVVFDAPLPAEWRRVLEARRVEPERGDAFVTPEVRLPYALPADRMPSQHLSQRDPQRNATRRAPSRVPAAVLNRGRREALGLKAPDAARRAIVMMAVLGPCRALEDRPR